MLIWTPCRPAAISREKFYPVPGRMSFAPFWSCRLRQALCPNHLRTGATYQTESGRCRKNPVLSMCFSGAPWRDLPPAGWKNTHQRFPVAGLLGATTLDQTSLMDKPGKLSKADAGMHLWWPPPLAI